MPNTLMTERGFTPKFGKMRWIAPYTDKRGRQKGGLWQVDISINGQRIQKYFKLEAEARRELTKLQNMRELSTLPRPHVLTVDAFLEDWITRVGPSWKYSTLKKNKGIVNRHLIPALTNVPLKSLTSTHIQQMLDKKSAEGLGPRQVFHLRAVLRNALEQAKFDKLIDNNPAAGKRAVKLPKIREKEPVSWGRPERKRFLEAIAGNPLEPLYLTLFWHGLRVNEALGLTWRHVELGNSPTISLYQQLQRQKIGNQSQRPSLEPTKTGSAAWRTIDLHPSVAAYLSKRPKAKAMDGLKGLVFQTDQGDPLNDDWLRDQLYALCEKADLPMASPHDFRHMCCIAMAENGVPIHLTSKFLGHENIATTLKWYSRARLKDMSAALQGYWTTGAYVPSGNGNH